MISESATSTFIDLPGVRLHYHDLGKGEPVIFLHGAGPGANSWQNFHASIAPFSKSYRTLLVDLPQFGKSQKIQIEGPRLSFGARVIRDFMDALGLRRAFFVGNSFGGQIAVKVAIDYPERVRSFAIIGSAPVVHSLFCPMPVEGVKLMATYYRENGGPTLEKMRHYLQTMLYDQQFVTEDLIRQRFEASIDPELVRLNQGPVPPRQDLTSEFSRVTAPALVIWGLDDRFGALDVGLLMTRAFQDARMHIFSKCGHWAQIERADECNALLLSFFARSMR